MIRFEMSKSGRYHQSQITGNRLLNKFTTTPYGEFHLKSFNIFNKTNPVHSFTGLGTKLDIRLKNYDDIMNHYNETGKLDITPILKDFSRPINRIDQTAMIHDVKYISPNLQGIRLMLISYMLITISYHQLQERNLKEV